MQFAQNKSSAQTNRQRGTPLRGELSKACELCGIKLSDCNIKENYKGRR
jgi:hypothetical protein